MFDLEKSIKEWRRQMMAGGINSSSALDELEDHLRYEIEQQSQQGPITANIFDLAVQRIGSIRSLKSEFDKDNEPRIMKRILIISVGVVGVLVGMALVMPAVAQYRHEGAMASGEVMLFWLGNILTLGGIGAACFGVKTRSA